MFKTPILFMIFNRPDTTIKVFESIKQIKPAFLFVAADGPRQDKPGESEICEQTRRIVTDNIDWECEVKTLFRDENLGCKYAVSDALKWFFHNVEMGIILEDDCLPTKSFFNYCSILLEYYKNDENIGMISGHNYFGKTNENKHDYSLITTCGIWGWASWNRVIKGYNPDYSFLIDHSIKDAKTICIRKDTSYLLLNNSYASVLNKINTWDYQLCEHLIVNNMYTIIPNINLIRNIGFINESTHTNKPPNWYKDISYDYEHEIRIERQIKLNKKNSKNIEYLFTGRSITTLSGIKHMIKYILKIIYHKLFSEKNATDIKSKNIYIKNDSSSILTNSFHIELRNPMKDRIYLNIGKDCILSGNYIFESKNGEINIGNNVFVGNSTLISRSKITLGNNVFIAWGCYIYDHDSHSLDYKERRKDITSQLYDYRTGKSNLTYSKNWSVVNSTPIIIKDDAWIGMNVIILKGVIIGEGSIIGAGSVVTHDIPDWSIAAGNPARIIKEIPEEFRKG